MGGVSPLAEKWVFKVEDLNIGWVGRMRNNYNFRIIRQGK